MAMPQTASQTVKPLREDVTVDAWGGVHNLQGHQGPQKSGWSVGMIPVNSRRPLSR
jgi:hypothetical protein